MEISNDLIKRFLLFFLRYTFEHKEDSKRGEEKARMDKNLLILIGQTGTRNGQTNKQEARRVTKRRALSDFQKYTLAHK